MNMSFNLIKRLVLFLMGMTIIQFGVALFLKSDIGSDPFTVFNQGWHLLYIQHQEEPI
jgi:Predicted membrane protein